MQKISLKKQFVFHQDYKDSGIAWIGLIPENWSVEMLKYTTIFVSRGDSPEYAEESGTPVINQACVYWGGINYGKIKYDTRFNIFNCKGRLYKGDLLMNSTGTGTLGRIALFDRDEKYLADGHITIVRTKKDKLSSSFLRYLYSTELFQGYIFATAVNGSTNQIELSRDRLRKVSVLLPKIDTQHKIAFFLDEKASTIDSLVEKKQKLIELLKEKRVSVINDALLNAGGKSERLKFSISINPSKGEVFGLSDDHMVSFVPMECISETGEISLFEKKYEEVKEGFTYFANNDVVLAKITPCYENGKAGVMTGLQNGVGFGTTEFIVLRPKSTMLPKYIYYLIFSDKFRKLGEVQMRGSAGQKRVPEDYVKDYVFNRPSIADQKKIVNFLDEKINKIDNLLVKINQSINLLQEYKSSLIYNIVTGKVTL